MDNKGNTLASVTDDIDGEIRNASTRISGRRYMVVSPMTCWFQQCYRQLMELAAATALKLLVINNTGDYPETGFNVITHVTGAVSSSFTQPYSDTLQPGSSDTLSTFTLNTSVGGTFNFVSYTALVQMISITMIRWQHPLICWQFLQFQQLLNGTPYVLETHLHLPLHLQTLCSGMMLRVEETCWVPVVRLPLQYSARLQLLRFFKRNLRKWTCCCCDNSTCSFSKFR